MTENHVLVNREQWDADADNWVEPGRRAWSTDEISGGAWSVAESDLRVLPDVDGLTSSSSGAARLIGPPGSREAGLGQ